MQFLTICSGKVRLQHNSPDYLIPSWSLVFYSMLLFSLPIPDKCSTTDQSWNNFHVDSWHEFMALYCAIACVSAYITVWRTNSFLSYYNVI